MGTAERDAERASYASLHAACAADALAAVDQLIADGADVNALDRSGLPALLRAGEIGSFALVKRLVDSGADVNASDKDGKTVLHYAAGKGDVAMLAYLVEKGADLNTLDKRGRSLLRYAAWEGNTDTLTWIIDHGQDVNVADKDGLTVLHRMVARGNFAMAKFFLEKGSHLNTTDKEGKSALHFAIEKNHPAVAAYLVEKGVDLSLTDEAGKTALHYATERENADLVRFLICHGANPNARDNDGNSVLHAAARTGNLAVSTALVDGGADPRPTNNRGNTALHAAARSGNIELIRYLLTQGTSQERKSTVVGGVENAQQEVRLLTKNGIDRRDQDGKSVLHYAVEQGNAEVIAFLLEEGASVTVATTIGTSVLHSAIAHENVDVVERLVRNGADVNAVTKFYVSVLHKAVARGKLDVVKYLIENDANINAVDKNGRTVLHYVTGIVNQDSVPPRSGKRTVPVAVDSEAEDTAHGNMDADGRPTGSDEMNSAIQQLQSGSSPRQPDVGRVEMVKFLVQKGACIDAVDKLGISVLHSMVQNGTTDMVAFLVERGANLAAKDKEGRSVLHYAVEKGGYEMIQYLVEVGAEVTTTDKNGRSLLHTAVERKDPILIELLVTAGSIVNAVDCRGHSALHDAVLSLTAQCQYVYPVARTLCSHGARWSNIASDSADTEGSFISRKKFVKWRLGLRSCVLLWEEEYQRIAPTLTDIPIEIVAGGEESVRTYIADLAKTTSGELKFRRKVCVVGPSEWGKTSLVKSLTEKRPALVNIKDRTIGIDLFSYSFTKVVNEESTVNHEITFWDFAGQDVYQVTHALFFSQRTLYLLCVNLEAYADQMKQAEAMSMKKAEVALNRFVSANILRWLRLVFTRQPDAQFVVVGTKADQMTDERMVSQVWQDLKARLFKWKQDLLVEFEDALRSPGLAEVTPSSSIFGVTGNDAQAKLRELKTKLADIVPSEWLVVSSAHETAVAHACQALEMVIEVSDRSFKMPATYSRVLEAIQARRQAAMHSKKVKDRIEQTIVPFQALYIALSREIDNLQYADCIQILQTLHDLGDIVWYEQEGAGYFKDFVILDPTLVLDYVREVINHKLSDTAGLVNSRLAEEGRLGHEALSQLQFWKDSDEELTHAFKTLLQHYQLAYPADGKHMDWDSDLIVPAYWKVRKAEDSLEAMLHQGAAPKAEVYWEYELPTEISETVFDHFAVQSFTPLFKRRIWRNFIETAFDGEFTSNIALLESRTTRTTIRLAVGAETTEVAWHYMRYFVMAMEVVLNDYPGLTPSRYIVQAQSLTKRYRVNDGISALMDASAMGRPEDAIRRLMPWLPPDLSWFIEKAWNDPGKLKDIQVRADVRLLISKTDVLKKLTIGGDTRRRFPALWTLDYHVGERKLTLQMLSDLSGDCFHEPIDIHLPPSFLSQYGSVLKAGLSLCSNVAPELLSFGLVNKAISFASSAAAKYIENATTVHNLIDNLGQAGRLSSTDNTLSPRGSATMLRNLLKLIDNNFDERRMCDVAKLVCAVTAEGSYVWASRQEIMAMADVLTPCDPDETTVKKLVHSDSEKKTNPPSETVKSLTSTATIEKIQKVRLRIKGTSGLPAWDWRRAYCKWELVDQNGSLVACQQTGQHLSESTEPSWSSLQFLVPEITSLDVLRVCQLRIELKRPSRWLGVVKSIASGTVVLDGLPEGPGEHETSTEIEITLDDEVPSKRLVVCEITIA